MFRYGRRSNWFKIHCALKDQEEAVHRIRCLDGGGGGGGASLNPMLCASQSAIPRFSPGTCIEEETKSGSPALSSPDSITSDTSVDVEPRRTLTIPQIPMKPPQPTLSDQEAVLAREISKLTNNVLANASGRGVTPPALPNTNLVAGLSFYGIQSAYPSIQAAQLQQMLYHSLLYPSLSRPILDPLTSNIYSDSQSTSSAPIKSLSNPPSPSSLPPPSTQREQLSNPASPQSLPAQSYSERATTSPSSDAPSPPIISRKRAADSPLDQDTILDLSVKRMKYDSPTPVSLPDLTPIPSSFSLLHLPSPSTANLPTVPLDLTTNA